MMNNGAYPHFSPGGDNYGFTSSIDTELLGIAIVRAASIVPRHQATHLDFPSPFGGSSDDGPSCQCAECLGEIGSDNSAVEKALKRHARGQGPTVNGTSPGRSKAQIEKCRLAAEKALQKMDKAIRITD
jgi:hypothetical protein